MYLGVSKELKNSVAWKFLYLNQNSVSAKIVCDGAASHGGLAVHIMVMKFWHFGSCLDPVRQVIPKNPISTIQI